MGSPSAPQVLDTVLPCGARLLVESLPGTRTVAIGVWLDVGSRDESESRAGAAHFVEHLLFKGGAGRDARALAEAMDRLGGQFNAFTSREHTCFHARTLDQHFADGAGLLAEMVLHASLRAPDVERERQVILAELAMIADDPGETADELFARALWGGHPLGRPQAGTVRGVEAFDAADARAFYDEHYVGRRAVIAVAGGVVPQVAADVVAKAFAGMAPGTPRAPRRPARPAVRRMRLPRRSEQSHLLLGAVGPALGDARRYAAELLVSILGGSPSSRLFQAVREDRGLCYDVGATPAAYTDVGEIAVFLASSPASAREAAAVTLAELRRLAAEGVPAAELALHRDQLLAGLWMGLEGAEARMGRLGRAAVAGLPLVPPEEVADQLAAVRADEVAALFVDLGDPAAWAAAYVGPRRGTPGSWSWEDVAADGPGTPTGQLVPGGA